MAATLAQQIALASDAQFRARVRNIVLQQASAVYLENAAIPNHNARVAFAFKLVSTPGLADQVADFIATRTNIQASNVSYDFDKRAVVTDASDAAILSQVATDWNLLSGV